MPPVSQKQRAAMGAAMSGHSNLGIPKSVGKEFIDADKGGKLQASAPKKKHSTAAMSKAMRKGSYSDDGTGNAGM